MNQIAILSMILLRHNNFFFVSTLFYVHNDKPIAIKTYLVKFYTPENT